ncbi:DUF6497 family protein [Jannaschia pohangensis]|uniref:Uncharacterized protein n=1 Tax=Jannaschia pohangensis TaxID=390807 RepID=A0A1I3IM45_9RHOB|nr:DUF6497 family protein [Jannaschia pohangensis]SFI48949.1 hypothetical protein SAMN04488095_1027 [Jannaschia pohangensis]
MMRIAALIACLAGPALAQDSWPSGQPLVLWEIVWERVDGGGTQAVLRFIAPEIARDGGSVDAAMAQTDLDWLCTTHALPVAGLTAARSDSVVITLMDRPVPRGTSDPDATQYFGLYRVGNGECLPEDY